MYYRSSGTAPVGLATIGQMFVPEKPADAFSEVLNSEIFLHFVWIIAYFTAYA